MTHVYELSGVGFDYGETKALRVDTLKIPMRGVTAVVGPNGAGKTTLLNLLAFLRWAPAGTIRFMDSEVTRERLPALRRRVGYVQQKPYLFNMSAWRNLEAGLRWLELDEPERRRRMDRVVDEFQLGDLVERPAHALSGGESQKIALARALVMEPEILILDEPFTYLDRGFAGFLESLMRDRGRDSPHTVIFTTHDHLRAERLGDSICSLIDGRTAPFHITNLLDGSSRGNEFDTGRLRIFIPEPGREVQRIAIDANQIVLSREQLDSSMRNAFAGRIKALEERDGRIHATVDAGEVFSVLVSREAAGEMNLAIDDKIWISFKASAVHVL